MATRTFSEFFGLVLSTLGIWLVCSSKSATSLQVVYEIVNRGEGNLSDSGHGHLYATCPWIDGGNSVSLENAPLVGENPIRIIKTHLPTKLCPYSEQAKYIYVTRHPVSCFASIVDFNRTMLGPLMPTMETMVGWFCSDTLLPASIQGQVA